jgi:hypothetical protein
MMTGITTVYMHACTVLQHEVDGDILERDAKKKNGTVTERKHAVHPNLDGLSLHSLDLTRLATPRDLLVPIAVLR